MELAASANSGAPIRLTDTAVFTEWIRVGDKNLRGQELESRMAKEFDNVILLFFDRISYAQRFFRKQHGQMRDEGFTLLELVVVVILLGLIAAIVMPNVLKTLFRAKSAIALQQIVEYERVLERFELDVGRYPTTSEGLEALLVRPGGLDKWDGPYLKAASKGEDPWGRDWIYLSPSVRIGLRDYDLCSAGPSGKAKNPDEQGAICNP